MRKIDLAIAVFMLSSACMLAQVNTAATNSNSAPPAQSSQVRSKNSQTIEGCLSGAANTFVLTDSAGKTYYLTGATSQLNANLDHKVRLWGTAASTGGGQIITAQGVQATFGVKKVLSLANSCQ